MADCTVTTRLRHRRMVLENERQVKMKRNKFCFYDDDDVEVEQLTVSIEPASIPITSHGESVSRSPMLLVQLCVYQLHRAPLPVKVVHVVTPIVHIPNHLIPVQIIIFIFTQFSLCHSLLPFIDTLTTLGSTKPREDI